MSVKVVDASALGALVFGEPDAERIAQELSDNKLIAPSLIHYELASICLKKIHKHTTQKDQLITAYRMAGKLGIETVSVDYIEVIELAEQTRLSAYDACYLWLARTSSAKLVTLDKQLKKAVTK